MNLTIKSKLLLVAAIGVVGIIIVGSMATINASSGRKLSSTETTLVEIHASMLGLRRHEKDFLARKDEKHLDKFQEEYRSTKNKIDDLVSHLQESDIDSSLLSDMANSLSRYADKFDTVAETLQEIGLDSESGLYANYVMPFTKSRSY
jgi:methyl-accepting chemotaxis protein